MGDERNVASKCYIFVEEMADDNNISISQKQKKDIVNSILKETMKKLLTIEEERMIL